ncbi:MAG: 4Fe-4S binding protein [Candidatus Hodarchaeota archaeon]
MLPRIEIFENCNQCGLCIKACPVSILQFKEKNPDKVLTVKNLEKCLECRACEQICPKRAILVDAF